MIPFYITPFGLESLKKELQQLKTHDRYEVIKAIATAREYGDLSENAEYHAAREKQSFIEARIADLEDKAARSEVIDNIKSSDNVIRFGATVKLIDVDNDKELTYSLVGEYEASKLKAPSSTLVSVSAPIARALISKKPGDSIEVETPRGVKAYDVLEVEYSIICFIS